MKTPKTFSTKLLSPQHVPLEPKNGDWTTRATEFVKVRNSFRLQREKDNEKMNYPTKQNFPQNLPLEIYTAVLKHLPKSFNSKSNNINEFYFFQKTNFSPEFSPGLPECRFGSTAVCFSLKVRNF